MKTFTVSEEGQEMNQLLIKSVENGVIIIDNGNMQGLACKEWVFNCTHELGKFVDDWARGNEKVHGLNEGGSNENN